MHSPDDHDRILETDHFHALAGIDIAIDRFSLRRDLSYTHFAHRCQARQRGTGLADQDIILLGGGGRRGIDRGFQRQALPGIRPQRNKNCQYRKQYGCGQRHQTDQYPVLNESIDTGTITR